MGRNAGETLPWKSLVMFPRCPQKMVREIKLSHKVDVLMNFDSGEMYVASQML